MRTLVIMALLAVFVSASGCASNCYNNPGWPQGCGHPPA